MISQAGIYKLDLYENKDFEPNYDSNGLITAFTYGGTVLNLTSNDNEPKYSNDIDSAKNNAVINTQKLEFHLDGINKDNIDQIESLQSSIYGFIPVIEFMDRQKYIILTPFFQTLSSTETQVSHTYKIEMKPRIETLAELIEYTP